MFFYSYGFAKAKYCCDKLNLMLSELVHCFGNRGWPSLTYLIYWSSLFHTYGRDRNGWGNILGMLKHKTEQVERPIRNSKSKLNFYTHGFSPKMACRSCMLGSPNQHISQGPTHYTTSLWYVDHYINSKDTYLYLTHLLISRILWKFKWCRFIQLVGQQWRSCGPSYISCKFKRKSLSLSLSMNIYIYIFFFWAGPKIYMSPYESCSLWPFSYI